MKIKINTLKCQRCNHIWIPRKKDVRTCPKCNSAYWETKKKVTRNK